CQSGRLARPERREIAAISLFCSHPQQRQLCQRERKIRSSLRQGTEFERKAIGDGACGPPGEYVCQYCLVAAPMPQRIAVQWWCHGLGTKEKGSPELHA